MFTQSELGLRYFQFNSFKRNRLKHAIFTRQGGVSPEPFLSLNVGGTTGDTRENVIENRRLIFKSMDLEFESIIDVWQVHGNHFIYTKEPRPLNFVHQPADIILTDQPGITLFMRFADCVPILLFDPVKNAIGLVHAGWKGTVLKAVETAVKNMEKLFSSQPQDIIAGIGPSIGPDHYEIGGQVVDEVKMGLNNIHNEILSIKNGKYFFDLWKANELILKSSGVVQIETARLCTVCNQNDWYSHRFEGSASGRFGVLLGML
jgi:YfiH family protein